MREPTASEVWYQSVRISLKPTVETRFYESLEILDPAGFNIDFLTDGLVGKTIALNYSTYHYLFLMYKIESLKETQHGVEVVPASDEVRFYGNVEGKLHFLSHPVSNLELFIPKLYASQNYAFPIYVGEDFIDAVKVQDEFAIGWKYPPKTYLSEEQIRQQEPDLSARIDAWLAARKMDISALVEQLRASARQHGIEVEVEYRTKTFASCYARTKRMNSREPELLNDINGIRLLPRAPDECYALLEIVHECVEFDDIRDLILYPKSNCFQGLICKAKDISLSLEVQMQTPRMKQVAEIVAGNYRNGYSL